MLVLPGGVADVGFASTVWGGIQGASASTSRPVVRGYFVFVFYISNGWRVAESQIDRWPGARARDHFGMSLG